MWKRCLKVLPTNTTRFSQIYFGPAKSSKDYFSELGYPCPDGYNPADHLLDVLVAEGDAIVEKVYSTNIDSITPSSSLLLKSTTPSRFSIDSKSDRVRRFSVLSSSFENKVKSAEDVEEETNAKTVQALVLKATYSASFFTQLIVLSRRSFDRLIRSPVLLATHLICSVVLGCKCIC